MTILRWLMKAGFDNGTLKREKQGERAEMKNYTYNCMEKSMATGFIESRF